MLLSDHVAQRLIRRPTSWCLIIFPSRLSSGNTVIGGNQEKGGHALDDDKRLRRFIILVPLSPSYEEIFLARNVAGCGLDLLFAHGKPLSGDYRGGDEGFGPPLS